MGWQFNSSASQGFTATGLAPVSAKPFAVSLWFYPFSTATNQTLWSICDSTSTSLHSEVWLSASGAGSILAIEQSATGARWADSGNTVIPNHWNHVWAGFFATTNRFVCLNGGPAVQNVTNVNTSGAKTRMAIGKQANSVGANPANGVIGEVAVFNLSQGGFHSGREIQWLAKGNSPVNHPRFRNQLVFYRNFGSPGDYDRESGDFGYNLRLTSSNNPTPGLRNTFQKKPTTAEKIVDFAMAVLLAPTIVVTNVALDAVAVGVTSLVRQVGKITTATGTGVTAFVRQVADNLNATGVGITGSVFSASKTLAVTATGVAAMTVTRVTQIILAAIALGVTTIVKQAQLVSAATATGVTAFVRGVATNLNATAVGITGSVFSAAKTLSATAVGVAGITVSSVVNRALAVVAIGVTSITMQVSKILAAVGIGVASETHTASTATVPAEEPAKFLGGGGIGLYGVHNARKRFSKRRRK